jgi:hypothetical protein
MYNKTFQNNFFNKKKIKKKMENKNLNAGGLLNNLLGLFSVQVATQNPDLPNVTNYVDYTNSHIYEKQVNKLKNLSLLQVPTLDFSILTDDKEFEESKNSEDEFYSEDSEEEEEKMYIMSLIKEYFEEQGLDKKTIQDILSDVKKNKENIYITRLRKLAESLGYLSLGGFLLLGYNGGKKLLRNRNLRNPRDRPLYYPPPTIQDPIAPPAFLEQANFFPGGTAYPPPAPPPAFPTAPPQDLPPPFPPAE